MGEEHRKKPDVLHRINNDIMKFKYCRDLETAAGVHQGLNSFYMQMRQEIYNLHNINIKSRRQKMRELFIQDFLREEQELAEVGIGYTNTQP